MKSLFNIVLFALLLLGTSIMLAGHIYHATISGAPPYGESEDEVPKFGSYEWMLKWNRPDGPARVGIQVGHWKNSELPDELEKLRTSSTGASAGGVDEWEVNLLIAQFIKSRLGKEGVLVDIIPATIPKNYWADVFITIHADGNFDPSKSGYKFASPWRDFTGNADELVSLLDSSYEKDTGLEFDPNITRNMKGYYAFSWWRYDHAIHPMTTAVIAETGFLTNFSDRQMLVNTPEIPAGSIANVIIAYLSEKELIN